MNKCFEAFAVILLALKSSSASDGQCDHQTFIPSSHSGCCGLEVTNNYMNYGPEIMYPYTGGYYSMINKNTHSTIESRGGHSTIHVENRIYRGQETELTQYPWTVFLIIRFENGYQQGCGGSLITSRYVLTAAHCFTHEGLVTKSAKVILAEYDTSTSPTDCKITGEGRKCVDNISIDTEKVITHPQFNLTSLSNDVAMMKLQSDAPYTDYIRPICLTSINIEDPKYMQSGLIIAGWGLNGQAENNIKQSTTIHLVPLNECQLYYPNIYYTGHFCAAGYNGEDACPGDSGGPVMVFDNGKYYIVGLVSGKSLSKQCGTSFPTLYTNVFNYMDWIRSTISTDPS